MAYSSSSTKRKCDVCGIEKDKYQMVKVKDTKDVHHCDSKFCRNKVKQAVNIVKQIEHKRIQKEIEDLDNSPYK